MLNRKSGAALWHQIGETLAAEISSGVLRPGDRLPTEQALVERFGVSRNTVRKAMSILEQDGLVRIEQGRGTFVYDGMVNYNISTRTRFSQNVKDSGLAPSFELQSAEDVPATREVAEALRIPAGAPVVHIVRHSKVNEINFSIGSFYYPAARFPTLLASATETVSQTALLKRVGVDDFKRQTTWIAARPPTADEARTLRLPRSRWIFVTRKIDVDLAGAPICFAEIRSAADRVQYVIDSADGDARVMENANTTP